MTLVNQTPRILVISAVHNEKRSIGHVLDELNRVGLPDVVVVDDGSTDGTLEILASRGVTVLAEGVRQGLGEAARSLFQYARSHGYEIIVTLAGNGKDNPEEIPRLLTAILENGYDLVQGSRYLPGGAHTNMPLYRWIGTRFVYPLLFFLVTGRFMTDATNGFRAFRMTLFDDPRIDLHQQWLTHYEMEPYVLYKAVTLGYKVKEVAVTKTYPNSGEEYTKMKPILGWWSILRPLILLGLRIKR